MTSLCRPHARNSPYRTASTPSSAFPSAMITGRGAAPPSMSRELRQSAPRAGLLGPRVGEQLVRGGFRRGFSETAPMPGVRPVRPCTRPPR